MARLRIVFMGTAELSCDSLRALAETSLFQVVGVVTQPDRPKGRNLQLLPTPVKQLATRLNIPILQPERARSEEFVQGLRAMEPELIAVAAYGQILPKVILDIPRYGCLNVHTSLLPKYRGAAPIQWAILNGEVETGVSIMKMDEGMDTGDVLLQKSTPVLEEDDGQSLHDRLSRMGADLIVCAIPGYIEGKVVPRPQVDANSSYAPKIKKQDGQIDWAQPATRIRNQIRALGPWPGAFSWLDQSPGPQLLKFWQAELSAISGAAGTILQADKQDLVIGCGQESLKIVTLQREGGKRLLAHEFMGGHPLKAGQRFTNGPAVPRTID